MSDSVTSRSASISETSEAIESGRERRLRLPGLGDKWSGTAVAEGAAGGFVAEGAAIGW